MTFFYDLNKKLQQVLETPKSEHMQLNERATMADESALQAYLGKKKYGEAGMKALQKAGREHASEKTMDQIRDKHDKMDEGSTGDYSAKKARAGKDIGKPGKAFAQIAKSAGERYGSKERGEKVAGAVLAKLRHPKEDFDEGMMDTVKKVGKKVAGGINRLVGHGSDEEMIKDLQRKSGAPVTGKKPTPPQQVKEKMSPAKQKSFAALAPPRDKITFADKIAGAKKEVDEMLGDVAAEAMRKAVGGGHGREAEMDESSAFDYKSPRKDAPRVGSVERGAKHDIKHTATGRIVTRRTDDQGISVGSETDDEGNKKEKRTKAGRPEGSKNVSSRAKVFQRKSKLMTKESDVDVTDQGEYDQEGDMAKNDIKTIVRHAEALHKILGDDDNLPEWVQSKLAKIEGMMISIDEYMQNQQDGDNSEEEPIAEKAVSKQQQKFMGMAHAMQKGEKIKGASKELKKVAKTMKPKDVEDFAATKHKGLPTKVSKKKKEEEVEESSTTAGAVATSTAAPKSSGGMSFGKGIYDSMNRELELMIAESMNINMSNSTEGDKSLTITATDEDAMKLAMMLKAAGLGSGGDMHSHDTEPCKTCGSMDCGCGDVQEAVDENAPDWPTNTETSDDALQYAGGLNKPKTDVAGDGQTTIPNTAVHTQDEDALRRMMEMAGLAEAAKPDFLDMDKDGNKEESMKDAVKDKEDDSVEESIRRMREMAGIQEAKKEVDESDMEEGNKFAHNVLKAKAAGKKEADLDGDGDMEKVRESIFSLTNQWRTYKG